METSDVDTARRPGAYRALIAAGWIASVLMTSTLLLVFWPGRVGSRQALLVSAGAAAMASFAAVAMRPAGRIKVVLAALILTPVATSAGVGGWLYRQYLSRTPELWAALDLEQPALREVKNSLAQGDIEAAEATALSYFRARRRLDLNTLPPVDPTTEIETSALVLVSTYKILEFKPVELTDNLRWDENPLGDRTWQWGLHTLPAVPALASQYSRNGNTTFIKKAEELVLDWIDDNQLYRYHEPSAFSWHDHVMALRVRGWLPFWETWVKSPIAAPKSARKILESILLHAERLADPRFYNEGHNHGMEQDFALLAIAMAFPEFRKSSEWRKTAARRLEAQTEAIISPLGIQLEHTPYYHVFTLEILSDAQEFARRMGVSQTELNLDPTLSKMARYTANLLKPDRTLPLIGDTPREPPLTPEHRTLSKFLLTDPVLRFALTEGREGEAGAATIFYETEGYAIFRDSWKPAPEFSQSFYLFFTAAANEGRVHKQFDDLSFTLHARGHELLTDAGFHSNQYGDPEREYVTGTSAHNSVLVDGKGFTGWTASIDACREGEGWALVQASHSNYSNVTHRRTLFYYRPGTVFVIDELRPKGLKPGEPVPATAAVHDFEQLFHFEPNCSATTGQSQSSILVDVGLARDSHPLLLIEQLAGGRGTARVVRGAKDPLQGWVADGHRTLVPAPVAIFKERGPEALFVTFIEVLEPSPTAASRLIGSNPTCSQDSKTGVILLRWPSLNGPRQATIQLNERVEVRL